MNLRPALLVLVLLARPGCPVFGADADEQGAAAAEPRQRTLTVIGSAIGQGEWKDAGFPLRKGERVTLTVEPVKTLGLAPGFRRDSLVFREGLTGPEYLFDTNARATWRKKGNWKVAPSRSFLVAADGALFYKFNQEARFTVRLEARSPP